MSDPRISVPSKRRRLRLTVRMAMLLLALGAIPLALRIERARGQREAVEAVLARHGWVGYDWQRSQDGFWKMWPKTDPPGPKWLHRLIGPEFFQDVEYVHLDPRFWQLKEDGADDDFLRLMGRLSQTQVTGRGLGALAGIHSLIDLDLSSTLLDDDGAAELGRLENLENLRLERTRITDEGLKHLTRLVNWFPAPIYLEKTRVTSQGIDWLDQALGHGPDPASERE